jgi:uncharacterized protein (UPF0262 family)
MTSKPQQSKARLYEVVLDEASIERGTPDQEHERAVAIYDLTSENSFAPPGRDDGPYSLRVAHQETKLTFDIHAHSGEPVLSFSISMTPFRPLLKDYFMVCENYYAAIRTASPTQIEAIDRERAALHNEGASLVVARFAERVTIDATTGRRLFTLISSLYWKA